MNFLQIFTEQDGQFSCRRTSAIFCFLVATFLAILIISTRIISNWYIFIPVALFLVVGLGLLYFTSWSEIKELAIMFKKEKE